MCVAADNVHQIEQLNLTACILVRCDQRVQLLVEERHLLVEDLDDGSPKAALLGVVYRVHETFLVVEFGLVPLAVIEQHVAVGQFALDGCYSVRGLTFLEVLFAPSYADVHFFLADVDAVLMVFQIIALLISDIGPLSLGRTPLNCSHVFTSPYPFSILADILS